MINGDDIVKWLGYGVDHTEFAKEMRQMGLKLKGTDSEYYDTHFNWKPKQSLRFELFRLAHFIKITDYPPKFNSDWIFVDIEFCRAGYDDSLKETFSGTPPFGLSIDNTAAECIAILGEPKINDYYEAPGFHYKVLAWISGDKYIGIAFENETDSARINCLGVSLVGAGVGWGVDWEQ
ncbi:MAG: hypothetical protein H7Z20_06275 [Bdellovibrio sp.]|nr:hypothetical protein [Methylotenera sp.]